MTEVSRRVLVAFDLDDTLYPERDYAVQALAVGAQFVEHKTGIAGIAQRALKIFESRKDGAPPLQRAIHEIAGDIPKRWTEEAIQCMRSLRPILKPFADVVPLLDALGHHCEMAVVTDGRSVTQRAKLDALGLTGRFSHIVISEENPSSAGKIDGSSYRILTQLTPGYEPRYMIGDQREKDVVAAENSGYKGLLIRRNGISYVHDTLYDNCVVLDDLMSVLNTVNLKL